MNIAVCDDLAEHRGELIGHLNEYFLSSSRTVSISEYESAEEFMAEFTAGRFQIVFLDIYMHGATGMDAARFIRESDNECAVIFTTFSKQYAVDSFEVRAADYLLKPYTKQEVFQALEWCEKTMADYLAGIDILTERSHEYIFVREIFYIEVYGRMSVVHTVKAHINTNRSLADFEQELEKWGFLRCHRCYLINMSCIQSVDRDSFVLQNGERIPISSDNSTKIKQQFFEWSFNKTWEG